MFICVKGCGECCGIVPLSKEVVARHLDDMQVECYTKNLDNEVILVTEDGLCAFLHRETKECMIYDERPEICHRFGTGIDKDGEENVLMMCPYLKANGQKWSEAKRKHLMRRVKQVMDTFMRLGTEGEKGMNNGR